MPAWLSFGILIVVVGVIAWLILRSAKRWQTPPAGSDPEAKQAEARLWTKKGLGGRGV